GSARLAPLPPPVPERPTAQRSTMLERFGPLARLLVHLLFRHVRVRAEAVEHLRQLAQQGTLIYVMRYRSALDYLLVNAVLLRDVVRVAPAAGRPVYLVPVAIFRGKGFRRKESRLATLLYSVQEAPGEAKRFFNYLWNAEETQLTLGREIVLDRFVQDYRGEGDERIVRRLARALQIFLYREERLVWGPPLLPRRVVRRQVLRDPELARLVRRIAAERGVPRRRVWKEARGDFDEMAANFNGLYFGLLEAIFNRIWPRVFTALEIVGLEKVIECVK